MQRGDCDFLLLQPMGQFFGMEDVGQLGLAVGLVFVVRLLHVQILPMHASEIMGRARDDDDSESRSVSLLAKNEGIYI